MPQPVFQPGNSTIVSHLDTKTSSSLISSNEISELNHKLGHYHSHFHCFIFWNLIFWDAWIRWWSGVSGVVCIAKKCLLCTLSGMKINWAQNIHWSDWRMWHSIFTTSFFQLSSLFLLVFLSTLLQHMALCYLKMHMAFFNIKKIVLEL